VPRQFEKNVSFSKKAGSVERLPAMNSAWVFADVCDARIG
jgi:hypothetical protein